MSTWQHQRRIDLDQFEPGGDLGSYWSMIPQSA